MSIKNGFKWTMSTVDPLLSQPCTYSPPSEESFVYFVSPTEISQLPFAWEYYRCAWRLGCGVGTGQW